VPAEKGIKIIKRCSSCQWRIFDVLAPATGTIEVKCPRCKNVEKIDLSLRRAVIKYRRHVLLVKKKGKKR
jgi:phage FluMu protein Com